MYYIRRCTDTQETESTVPPPFQLQKENTVRFLNIKKAAKKTSSLLCSKCSGILKDRGLYHKTGNKTAHGGADTKTGSIEQHGFDGAMSSRISQLNVIDILYLGCVYRNYSQNSRHFLHNRIAKEEAAEPENTGPARA